MKKLKLENRYRDFHFKRLKDSDFSHVWLLLYWPIYGILFIFVERFYSVTEYHITHFVLDDMIPFNEIFLVPYLLWFIYIAGMLILTFFFDIEGFKRMMKFIILTYTVAIAVYIIYPTCQNLRPTVFTHDNIMVSLVKKLYLIDTNTNVCPSIHVFGALAAMFTSWNSKALPNKLWRGLSTGISFLICLSTVFIKQHSILDVLAALPLSLFAYYLFWKKDSHNIEHIQ